MEFTMYDNLLQLPLFQGLSKEDITRIIERVKLNFLTYKEGEIIVKQGEPCQQLAFLLGGEIVAETNDEEHHYTLSETFGQPYVIEPYSLFGMQTFHTATYRAKQGTQLLCINKAFIFSHLCKYEIFRINYFNILSNLCQQAHHKLWKNHEATLEKKFASFLTKRCLRPYGEKNLRITMEDLSNLTGETRINVSRLLNDLQKKGLVQLRRSETYIPALEKLTAELLQPNRLQL